ncbi:response regulator [Bordetella petrii]|uniref:response regulator n=1 Tax=Bordetella petrii TaxID=94624 RepID=UPI001A96291C|nr:response regulator [Bordetella petrii]MBO1114242.1 response regulator [Bordetella petrii]
MNESLMERLRILYVDDEDDIREIAVFALELDGGLEVKSCSSGAQAVEQAAAWQPHLILLDVMMPGMDGPTTMRRIREQPGCEQLPIAFITARAQSEETQRLLALGAVGVVPKPFDALQLARITRTLARGKT